MTGDRSWQAPTGDRSWQAPTGDRSWQAPTGDRSWQAPTGDRSWQAPTGDRSDRSLQAPSRPSRGQRAPAFWVLVLLSGVSPLATDMYLPALPSLGRSMHVGAAEAQFTLTAFLIGLALGQIALGPLSDSAGRRPFLLWGPVCFAVSSAVCAVTPGAAVLVVARFVEGFAGASGMVAARAVVSDYYSGDEAAARFGLLSGVSLLAPVVAPAAGSALLLLSGWRTIFFVLTGVGGLQALGSYWGIHETLEPPQRHPGSVRATAGRVTDLLGDRNFMGHLAVSCLAVMGFFSYIGGSSFVLERHYHLGTSGYGLVFAVDASTMAVASLMFARLVRRFGVVALRRAGLVLAGGPSAALALWALTSGHPPLAGVWCLLAAMTAGMGLVLPASTALTQEAGDRAKGTASALGGGLTFSAGALMTPLTGLIGNASLLTMSSVLAGFLVIAGLVAPLARRQPAVTPPA